MRRLGPGLVLCATLLAVVGGQPVAPDLNASEQDLRDSVYDRGPEMVEMLRSWVEINTGTWNVEGLTHLAAVLAAELRGLGFKVEIDDGVLLDLPGRRNPRTGPTVVARRGPRRGTEHASRLLLIGHTDTVFEIDSPFQGFFLDPERPGRGRGPGASDMKGGLVVMIETLRALRESGDLDLASVTVLLNSDEEIGSLGSRALLEAEARRADYGFVYESAQSSGALVESRRGLGQFNLVVEGTPAHAGAAHDRGRSAIRELAEKVVLLERLTDYTRGVTVNVGLLRGGTKRNIVPARAEAWIDVRYDSPELGRELEKAITEIARMTFVKGTQTRVWGVLHRPPKTSTEGVRALLDLHAEVSRELGLKAPPPVHAGGGTDGSLTGAQGLPTLDTMGPVGGECHTEREYVWLSSLSERTAVGAILLRRLIRQGAAGPEG
jgi:glutamate carboxypeptidase